MESDLFTTVPCADGEIAVLTKTKYLFFLKVPRTSVLPLRGSSFLRRSGFQIHYNTADAKVLCECHKTVVDVVRRLGFHSLCDRVDAGHFPWPEERMDLQQHVKDLGEKMLEGAASGLAFVQEMLGRAALLGVTYAGYRFKWWAPVIVAPIFWQVWTLAFKRIAMISGLKLKLVADIVAFAFHGSYMVCTTLLFGLHLGHWYGWTAGAVVGIFLGQILGLLLPWRWHDEKLRAML